MQKKPKKKSQYEPSPYKEVGLKANIKYRPKTSHPNMQGAFTKFHCKHGMNER